MRISIIVAMSSNRVIGRDGQIPWHLPDDLKRFKQLTTGHPIIMGRKTYQSIGRPLPNRTNIVLTRDDAFDAEGCVVVHDLDAALAHAREVEDDIAFIIGGGHIYEAALPLADVLDITHIDAHVEGDTFFPLYDESVWRCVMDEAHDPDDRHAHPFRFARYEWIADR
jgi:dihydrofolate reductase